MSLHRLTSVTIGVPNVAETAAYYQAFGLTEVAPGRLATTDGGEQLILVERARRELVALGVGVDDPGDLIFTGTPAGVGAGRTPPRFLRPGDVLTSYVQGVGEMRHVFEPGSAA